MFAMALADVFWTLYFIDVEGRRAHHASTWSAMIILVTAFTVTNYVDNQIYIAAAFIGAYLGRILLKKVTIQSVHFFVSTFLLLVALGLISGLI